MKTRKAQEGYWLTQSTLENEEERSFCKEVAGAGDLDSLFTEWTSGQKEEWEEKHPPVEPENNN